MKNAATPMIRLFLSLALLANHAQGSYRITNLVEFASHWLETGCEQQPWCDGYDLNLSGQVDFHDFSIFADKWRSNYESDSDGDGLSDFQEVHKYRTDPTRPDTDADGIDDGDWNKRREYTYSVRSIMRFMHLFDEDEFSDNFQDARVLSQTGNYTEMEVIHYPFSTAETMITANPNWQTDYADMTEYLEPGITTNWDAQMRQDLLAELQTDGIIVDELTDKQVVEHVSYWVVHKYSVIDAFTTFFIYYPQGQPEIYPGLQHAFNREKGPYGWTVEEQFEHELLGKGMYYNKTRGSCTSTAIALTTALRAVGVPTRMIHLVPVVDPSDENQFKLVQEQISNDHVRQVIFDGLDYCRRPTAFVTHMFCEVYVGNRWHRLNYDKLGQGILDVHLFGLTTHLYTYNDLSDANLASKWGWRYGKGLKDDVFRYGNPYSTVTLSDHFGYHNNIENPSVREHKILTITKAYWFHSSERPSLIPEEAVPQDNDGHILFHIDEWFEGESTSQYFPFYNEVDMLFLLKSEGHSDIRAYAERGMWSQEFYVRIPESEYAKMVPGVPYTIHPVNSNPEYQWRVAEGVTISKENN